MNTSSGLNESIYFFDELRILLSFLDRLNPLFFQLINPFFSHETKKEEEVYKFY